MPHTASQALYVEAKHSLLMVLPCPLHRAGGAGSWELAGLEKNPDMSGRYFHREINFPEQVLELPLLSSSTKPWDLGSPSSWKA